MKSKRQKKLDIPMLVACSEIPAMTRERIANHFIDEVGCPEWTDLERFRSWLVYFQCWLASRGGDAK